MLHPLEFPIELEDYGRTSNLSWHENHNSSEVSLKVSSKEWSMEVKHFSKAIQILSPSMTMPCSLKGTIMEALHNPTVRTNIMSQFLAETLLGSMPLVPIDKLFKSPSGLIFESCGIARAVPFEIHKTVTHSESFFKKNLPMGALVKSWEKSLPPLTQLSQ
jgi:hypothetical protein